MNNLDTPHIVAAFNQTSNLKFNKRIQEKMRAVLNVELQYAAVELSELSEEILNQVSALGICLYLKKTDYDHKERYNDYILHNIFLSEEHKNAGPIFKTVCNAITEITEASENQFKEIFDLKSDFNISLANLSKFRNALFHGFFVLPPEKNLEIIHQINHIVLKLIQLGVFNYPADYHFWDDNGFTGNWHIKDEQADWLKLFGDNGFGQLAKKSYEELYTDDFIKGKSKENVKKLDQETEEEINSFIYQNDKDSKEGSVFYESLLVTYHPEDVSRQNDFYENIYDFISKKEDVEILAYTINAQGIGYTSYLLLRKLCEKLKLSTPKKEIKKKEIKEEIKNEKDHKLVILLNNIHLVPFAHNHITTLFSFFKECKIHFIGIGQEFEFHDSIFKKKIKPRVDKNILPDENLLDELFHNYTRHRGPFENDPFYLDLWDFLKEICNRLKINPQPIVARRLADELKLDIELVHEAFYILYPTYKFHNTSAANKFEEVKFHELYGYPETQTETTSIFLTLGRRDIDLEYKHKILGV